jgi:F-type H+-transporting ATPase subunit b
MIRKASILTSAAIAAMATLAALPALASEAAHGEGGSVSPFTGDIGNIFWTVLIFGLVVVVLGKFAWGPVLQGLQGREDFIRQSLEKADAARRESEVKLQEYLDKINGARAEASAIVEEGRRDADALKRQILADTKAEQERERERTKREIEIAKDTALEEIFSKSGRLATDIARGVLGREIDAKDHERLISDAIARLESGDRSGRFGAAN